MAYERFQSGESTLNIDETEMPGAEVLITADGFRLPFTSNTDESRATRVVPQAKGRFD